MAATNPSNPQIRIAFRPGAAGPVGVARSSRELAIEELARTSDLGRWGWAVLGIGAMHLAASVWLQSLMWAGDRTPWKYVATWFGEVAAVMLIMRLAAGPRWLRAPGMAGVVIRVWITYLILAFSMASSSHLSGSPFEWYRPGWTTLGSFGFATMAWLVDLRFLVFAFQMYFTGLLMLRFPGNGFLIHGLSWGLALGVLGLVLERRRAQRAAEGAWADGPDRTSGSFPAEVPCIGQSKIRRSC